MANVLAQSLERGGVLGLAGRLPTVATPPNRSRPASWDADFQLGTPALPPRVPFPFQVLPVACDLERDHISFVLRPSIHSFPPCEPIRRDPPQACRADESHAAAQTPLPVLRH